jgi:hypothetical protein
VDSCPGNGGIEIPLLQLVEYAVHFREAVLEFLRLEGGHVGVGAGSERRLERRIFGFAEEGRRNGELTLAEKVHSDCSVDETSVIPHYVAIRISR